MKLIITVGNSEGVSEELVFDVPTPTWMGVEIEDPRTPEEAHSNTGRMTIVRIPFANHEQGLHTMCSQDTRYPGIIEVPTM